MLDNYSKTCWSLWHYYRHKPYLNANGAMVLLQLLLIFLIIITALFKFKTKIAGRRRSNGTKSAAIRVPLKYLSNVWRTLEMLLINCQINLTLTWSNKCFIINNPIAGQEPTFSETDMKLYVPFVTLSTQDNAKLLVQLKSRFKRTVNWNEYEPKVTVQQKNGHLDF